MSPFRLALSAFIILTLTACASKPVDFQALKRDKISSVVVASDTMLTFEPSVSGGDGTAASGGGLLGAVIGASIDSSINSKRKKRFAPINDVFQNEDLRALFSQQLSGLSGEVFNDSLVVSVTEKLPGAKEMKDNSLNLNANYYLSSDHQSVIVNAQSTLKTNQEGGNFYHLFNGSSSVDLGGTKVDIEDVTQFWVDNPEELKNTVTAAMQEIVKKIQTYYNTDQSKK